MIVVDVEVPSPTVAEVEVAAPTAVQVEVMAGTVVQVEILTGPPGAPGALPAVIDGGTT